MTMVADLERIKGKAELVNGSIVLIEPHGALPGHANGQIVFALMLYEDKYGGGHAFNGMPAYIVSLPQRESFCPDAAWYTGISRPDSMKFLVGAPVFAVEVRSENDYGAKAEQDIADKIADYFAAGTLVVWDVDLQGENVITKHSASDPNNPTIFKRGSIADAEPAVPGWIMDVDALFH